jgi:hypothetical protein
MDLYTIALIVLAIVVAGGFGYFVLRPESHKAGRGPP